MTMKDLENQTRENAVEIKLIKQSIKTIETNHLAHLEADVREVHKKIDKVDNRMWMIAGLVVTSVIASFLSEAMM